MLSIHGSFSLADAGAAYMMLFCADPSPEPRSNDTDPMWIDDTVYFRSDRNGEWLERHSASHHHHGLLVELAGSSLLAELMHRQA